MDVRPAGIEDAEAIAEVHVATWHTAYRGAVPDAHLDALDVGQRAQLWRRGLATGSSTAGTARMALGRCLGGARRHEDLGGVDVPELRYR